MYSLNVRRPDALICPLCKYFMIAVKEVDFSHAKTLNNQVLPTRFGSSKTRISSF